MARKKIFGKGINDASYTVKPKVNGHRVLCPYYSKWQNMYKRCYSEGVHTRQPEYSDCKVDSKWRSFMAFKKWMEKQVEGLYDVDGLELALDKDLLVPGNKLYSFKKCVLVSRKVNSFIAVNIHKGSSLPGSCLSTEASKYRSFCRNPFTLKQEYLGLFDSELDAHYSWLNRKRELADELADSKYVISSKVRKALKQYFHKISYVAL